MSSHPPQALPPPSAQLSRRWQADLALGLVALIWGATFVIVKEALDHVSTMLFLALRFTIALVALALLFRKTLSSHYWSSQAVKGGVLAGAFLLSGYVLQTFGLKFTTAGKSGFITGLYVVLVPFLSAVVYKKTPQRSECAGILVAVIGMALMTLPEFRSGIKFEIGIGDLLTVGCAVAYAFHILVLGYYSRRVGFEILTVLQIGTAAVLAASTCWWVETPRVVWNGSVLLALGVTSLLATALAFAAQTWAQQHTTPTRTALIFALEPVFALFTSFWVMGEVLSKRAIVGAIMILAGIVLVEMKPMMGKEHPS